MKRVFFALALLMAVLMSGTACAAKARYLAYDGDTGFHSRHLAMHTGEETCRACANYLKVRSRASGSASVSGHVEQADLLQLLDMSGNWARVRVLYSADTSPDSWPGLTGWVDASYLECGCSERTYYNGRTDPIEGGEILTGGVNLRELPSMSSRSLGKCTRGERVRVLGRYDSYGYTFYRVTRRSGQNGFVRSDYLSIGGSVPSMHYDSGSYTPPDSGRDYDDRGYDGGVRATTYQLRVRATPNGEIIGHISQLDYLELLERSGNWARIRVTAARSGYDDCYTGLTAGQLLRRRGCRHGPLQHPADPAERKRGPLQAVDLQADCHRRLRFGPGRLARRRGDGRFRRDDPPVRHPARRPGGYGDGYEFDVGLSPERGDLLLPAELTARERTGRGFPADAGNPLFYLQSFSYLVCNLPAQSPTER